MYNRDAEDLPGLPERGFRPGDYILGMAFDLKLILVFILMMAAFIYIPALNGTIIRTGLGLVMILFMPGYAFMAALFPGRAGASNIERGFLSFTFSVVVTALFGFGLNYTPVGISLDAIIACLAIFILVCVLMANKRRQELPADERFSMDISILYRSVAGLISPGVYQDGGGFTNKALNVLIVIALLISIGTVAYAIVSPKQGETFTEFYILGPDGIAGNYPANIVLGNETSIVVGAVNHEHRDVTYDVVVSMNGTEKDKWLKTDRFTLADNETMEKKVKIMPNDTGTNLKMQFLLYADGNFAAPYKELHLWVNVTAPVNASVQANTTSPLTEPENTTAP